MQPNLVIEYVAIHGLRASSHNARRHPKKQLKQLAASIKQLGFNTPILAKRNGEILAGHARVEAAKVAGLESVPVVWIDHLDDLQSRAFMIADNKIAQNATWDLELLSSEIEALIDVSFDLTVTGFEVAEIDLMLTAAKESSPKAAAGDAPEDAIPVPPQEAVTERGDVWLLGRHRLVCGDARDVRDYNLLLEAESAHVLFTDPPYNVPVANNVCGLGKIKHAEFAMASGEMSSAEFTSFLAVTLGYASKCLLDGSIAYVCMDWRHMSELLQAGSEAFTELKNLCVWAKTNGGMGAFYRSRHELVFVFKKGTAAHTNNFGLGETGRYRTNVWEYRGISSMSATRDEELAMHPTVKPVALVEDALRDCSRRGEIVLDPFGGSGTTLIAAHKCGRIARLIEYEPRYCDTTIARFEKLTGKRATLAETGETFEDVAAARSMRRDAA
jgi:ParB-like chromosome segregation protein Spo0J